MSSIFRPFRSSEAERSDRTAGDRARHRGKIKKALRDNIADILSDESIIGKDRGRIIKVPVRGIKEYRFVYGSGKPGVGTGDGSSQPGQVVGKQKGDGAGQQDKAGDKPGEDYYETDVTLDELIELMFEDLSLPDLERTKLRTLVAEVTRKRLGYRKTGINVRLDKVRTLRRKKARLIQRGLNQVPETIQPQYIDQYPLEIQRYYVLREDGLYHQTFPFSEQDLTYKHYDVKLKPQSNAVVICIMDTSGSMDTQKKYLARCFFFLLYQFVKTKYNNVEVVFIAHHTEAKEVTEDEFFHKGESGGTFISSGYVKALEVIAERYHPEMWNIYTFHCSDGDNFGSDNNNAIKAAHELCEVCNLFGYAEIKPPTVYHESSMLKQYQTLQEDNFATVVIKGKDDVLKACKTLLAKERVKDFGGDQ